jgi:hypothetical protein
MVMLCSSSTTNYQYLDSRLCFTCKHCAQAHASLSLAGTGSLFRRVRLVLRCLVEVEDRHEHVEFLGLFGGFNDGTRFVKGKANELIGERE